ncbi:chlN [Mytilus coruscus]|uniref:ChlN n=1 Tax=Mytilus coruscus TaxID=42192 RepID=A0A6J8CUI9_MYTCO|nr:chlN [Mytilus coruscus]
MSKKKLLDFLQKQRRPLVGTKHFTPVVLSDSKGLRFASQVVHPFDRNILWWCASGRTIQQGYDWLTKNIEDKIKRHGNLHIFVWLGTCNTTTRDKNRYISRKSQEVNAAQNIIVLLQNFDSITENHPNCRLTLLEIPIYSIYECNKAANHPNPETRTFSYRDK